jgi:hypothetical protein
MRVKRMEGQWNGVNGSKTSVTDGKRARKSEERGIQPIKGYYVRLYYTHLGADLDVPLLAVFIYFKYFKIVYINIHMYQLLFLVRGRLFTLFRIDSNTYKDSYTFFRIFSLCYYFLNATLNVSYINSYQSSEWN